MAEMIWGIIGFGLFVIYDINSVTYKNSIVHASFAVGCFLITISTILQFIQTAGTYLLTTWTVLFLILSALFFFLMIYTLFFSLPFEKTYGMSNDIPKVCDQGMYALCRHPGVIWFVLFYMALSLSFRDTDLLHMGVCYSFCNILYVVFQDIWTFPRTFADYEGYKKTTPFLIPNASGIRRAWNTGKLQNRLKK